MNPRTRWDTFAHSTGIVSALPRSDSVSEKPLTGPDLYGPHEAFFLWQLLDGPFCGGPDGDSSPNAMYLLGCCDVCQLCLGEGEQCELRVRRVGGFGQAQQGEGVEPNRPKTALLILYCVHSCFLLVCCIVSIGGRFVRLSGDAR